jgi:hypothetical protein
LIQNQQSDVVQLSIYYLISFITTQEFRQITLYQQLQKKIGSTYNMSRVREILLMCDIFRDPSIGGIGSSSQAQSQCIDDHIAIPGISGQTNEYKKYAIHKQRKMFSICG